MISEGECLVGFDQDGSLRTHQGFRREEQGNIFHHPLEEILRLYTPETGREKRGRHPKRDSPVKKENPVLP